MKRMCFHFHSLAAFVYYNIVSFARETGKQSHATPLDFGVSAISSTVNTNHIHKCKVGKVK